jgi:putative transposase
MALFLSPFMVKIEILPGKRYQYQGHYVRLQRTIDLGFVLGEYEATGALVRIPINDLQPLPISSASGEAMTLPQDDILSIPEEAWAKAQRKLEILRPILAARGDLQLLNEVARTHQLSQSTIYRWLRAYEQSNSVRSLVEQPRTGGKGQARLNSAQDAIIQQAIESHYLTPQKKPVTKVILEVRQQCQQLGLQPPADNTVRRRIRQLSQEEKVRMRWSKKIAKEQFEPLRGSFPGATYPLAVVQIDHTLVDLILVDEAYRQPLGRPWLTMAIDVFSRMVVGFYLSFDPPGAVGTGLCLAHSILPKELWLSRMNVQGEWPCWGVPSVLHADNAKEFRGAMLQRACEKYGIRLEWRPVGKPHWGGHIERLMGTFMQEVHTLPGTTFSNVRGRKDYPSEKKASLTLREFEQWLTTFIVDVYHKRIHQSLKKSPYERYREGIFGGPDQPGTGLPERIYDELQVRLDFMPSEERTVQEYGVLIDHVHYYADVLKPYINTLEDGAGKSRLKRKFTFKRDPRDISCLYFLEPATRVYHRIPYRDTSHPAISVWEFRQAIEQARLKGIENLDEDAIFAAYDSMRAIELAAVERTKKVNKSANRLLQGVPVSATSVFFQHGTTINNIVHPTPDPSPIDLPVAPRSRPTLTPFDGLYDDASFTPEYGETA